MRTMQLVSQICSFLFFFFDATKFSRHTPLGQKSKQCNEFLKKIQFSGSLRNRNNGLWPFQEMLRMWFTSQLSAILIAREFARNIAHRVQKEQSKQTFTSKLSRWGAETSSKHPKYSSKTGKPNMCLITKFWCGLKKILIKTGKKTYLKIQEKILKDRGSNDLDALTI